MFYSDWPGAYKNYKIPVRVSAFRVGKYNTTEGELKES